MPAARVPWGSWYEESELELTFPDHFEVEICPIQDAPGLSQDEIRRSLSNPIQSPRLRDLARDAKSAVIAVDDISRPTRAASLLPAILDELSGLSAEKIKIIIALGAHRPLVREELEKKLGTEILTTLDVEQHHPYENLVDLGKSSRGTPIFINRNFLEADLKITLGAVLPHPYAGFGGGAKLVLPGLAGIETLRSNHQPAVTGITGGLGNPEVDARKDIEEIALKAGLNFTCNVVVNGRRETAGFFCGHPVASHREAARCCAEIYRTRAPRAPYDAVILNAYPKDTELLQAGNVFNCYRNGSTPLVGERGKVVVTACCSTGRGYHSLHGKDMRLYRSPVKKQYLNGRDLVLYSSNINRKDFEVSFWEGYRFCLTWPEVTDYLATSFNGKVSIGVLPLAPLQMLT